MKKIGSLIWASDAVYGLIASIWFLACCKVFNIAQAWWYEYALIATVPILFYHISKYGFSAFKKHQANGGVRLFSWLMLGIFCISALVYLYHHLYYITLVRPSRWLVAILFVVQAVLYYAKPIYLRQYGIIKPIVIANCWLFLVCIFPVYIHRELDCNAMQTRFILLFWLHVCTLSIMYDYKDVYKLNEKTIAQTLGLTLSSLCVVLPLLVCITCIEQVYFKNPIFWCTSMLWIGLLGLLHKTTPHRHIPTIAVELMFLLKGIVYLGIL